MEESAASSGVEGIKRRLADQQQQSERQLHYINQMHEWAAKTADALREMQRQCEGAEAAALAAQRESLALRLQLAQLAAQQDASLEAVARVESKVAALSPHGASSPRQHREAPLTSAVTADSLNADRSPEYTNSTRGGRA